MIDRPRKRSLAIALLVGVGVGCVCVVGAMALMIRAARHATEVEHVEEGESTVRELALRVEASCSGPFVVRGIDSAPRGLPGPAGPTPPLRGREKRLGEWGPEWSAIGFALADPTYFSYSIVREGPDILVVRAEADIDADGIRSRFESRCIWDGHSCACGDVTIENGLE